MLGGSIAVLRGVKSGLWATGGGKVAETCPKRFSQAAQLGDTQLNMEQHEAEGSWEPELTLSSLA